MTGLEAFNLLQTHGFPIELTLEIANERGIFVDIDEFNKLKEEHSEKVEHQAVECLRVVYQTLEKLQQLFIHHVT